jgi:ABC-type glycerol-3-phosphate transport system substrate-binding protein
MGRTLLALIVAALCLLPFCGRETDRRVVLRVADWGGPAGDPTFLRLERNIRLEFERRCAGVRIQAENIPGPGQYVPKLLMTYVAGNPPDVITLDASSSAVFINHDLLTDLLPRIHTDPGFCLSDYFVRGVVMGGIKG